MSQALLAADAGSVVTWGNAEFGADSSAMQTQLKNVQQIQANDGAFAAILDDGAKARTGNRHMRSRRACVCVCSDYSAAEAEVLAAVLHWFCALRSCFLAVARLRRVEVPGQACRCHVEESRCLIL